MTLINMDSSKHTKRISYRSSEANDAIQSFRNSKDGNLLVFVGKNRSDKKGFAKKFGDSLKEIDLRDIVSTVESDTYENLDSLFDSISESETVYLQNGDVLSGEYTGNTYSFRRYATPQEKYLIKKIKQSNARFILDLLDEANVTNRLERVVHSVIRFNAPKSGFGKLFWNLKNVSVHGHTFENKRPLKK